MRRLCVCCSVRPADMLSFVRQFALVLFALGFLAWSLAPSHAQANLEDFESGYLTGASARFPWVTGGTLPWAISGVEPQAGQYSAASGPVSHGQSSSVEISYAVNGAAPLSFYYKTSSEAGKDVLRFSIDGEVKLTASGETAWTLYSSAEPITPGTHKFKWEFVRDGAGEAGSNRVWLDNVLLPMANGLVLLSPQGGERWFSGDGNVVRWVSMGPDNGSTVSIEVSGDDMVSWQTVGSGVPNTGRYIWTFGQLPPPSAPTRYVRIVSDTGATSTTPGKVDLWEENEGFESGGLSTWPWINNGIWQVTSEGPFRGAACVRGNGKLSLQLNVASPGFVRFLWKNSYYLNCYIDGVLVYSADLRDMVYRPVSVPITAGVHQIDFVAGNTCYIDCLSLPTGSGVLLEDPHGADVDTGARQAWIAGYQQAIRWFNFGGTGSTADLQYSIDNGSNWVPFANGTGVENKPGHNAATVIAPAQTSSTFRVRVVPSTGLPTASKSNFEIWPETDGFESGGLSSWPWINSGSWQVMSGTSYRGSASVKGSGKLSLRINAPASGFVRFMSYLSKIGFR